MKVQKKASGKYVLYSLESTFFPVLGKIIKKEYETKEILANRDKTYVAKIEIDGLDYILKKMMYDGNIKRRFRKFLTFFRDGDCLRTFLRINEMREKGCGELVEIYGAGVYKKGIIHDQFILMPCVAGHWMTSADFSVAENFLKKLHLHGRYHGSTHAGQFLVENGKLSVIDTKLNKMVFGNFRAHIDMLRLHVAFGADAEYPYEKNFYYTLCKLYASYCLRKSFLPTSTP